jgi:anti-anti-sigma factor
MMPIKASEPLMVVETTAGAITVLSLTGVLDSRAAPVLEEHISRRMEGGKKYLLFDFKEVKFLGTLCIKVLSQQQARARALDGRFVLVRLSKLVRDVLDVIGFLPFFEVHDTVEEGLAAFTRPAPPPRS